MSYFKRGIIFLFILVLQLTAQERRVIGIIPFANQNGRDRNQWVSRGIEEILYDKLKSISGFLVYEKETLDRYLNQMDVQNSSQIGPKQSYKLGKVTGIEVMILGDYKVESSGKITIHAKFINTYTGGTIYDQTYYSGLNQLFSVFERVVKALLETTQVEATPDELAYLKVPISKSIKAFQYYCQAYEELDKPGTRMEVAAGLFGRALREDPDFWEAQYNMGVIYYSFNFLDRAIGQFNKVIQRNPSFYKPYYGRGVIYFVKRDYRKAKNDFKHVLALKKDHDRSLYYLGAIANFENKMDEAIKLLKQSIEINPDYAPAHFQLGVAFKKQRKYRTAIKIIRQALNLNSEMPEAHNIIGECYYRINMFDEALTAFNKAIELKVNYANAYFNLANTIYKKNSLQEIVTAYMDLLEAFFGEEVRNRNRDRAASEAGDAKPLTDQAKKVYHDMILAYKKAILYDPSFYESAFNLALTYDNLNMVDSAYYFYRLALDIEPTLARAHLRIAKIYENQGDYVSALQEYKEVVKSDVSFFASNPKLGEKYRYVDIIQETVKELQSILDKEPSNIEALTAMGRIYFGLNRMAQARRMFEKVVQIKPGDKEAGYYLNQMKKM